MLDPVVLSRMGTMALKARAIVEGALSGFHRSPHHGSSVEFAEHKEYSPGDEIRHIDWKAYGKFDRYYVKRFEEETELTAYLVIDRSGSMAYKGSGLSKLEYATHLAAAMAYLLIKQQDRVGVIAVGGPGSGRPGADRYVPPRSHANHLPDLMRTLEAFAKDGGAGPTDLAGVLARTAELAQRRRSLVILLSDLFDPTHEATRALRRLRVQRHDVSVVQILDRDELELPFEDITMFESLEDDRRLLADPRAVRTAYLRELSEFLDKVQRDCREGDVEHRLVPTDQPLERTLLDLVTSRARGRA